MLHYELHPARVHTSLPRRAGILGFPPLAPPSPPHSVASNMLRLVLSFLFVTNLAIAVVDAFGDDQPTNFIVVYCDNLGYGDIEPFGSTLHRTPNLNRMAREGRKFTHFCVTAGVCTPSRASLMTGCYAQRLGMHNNPRDGWVLRPVSPYGLAPDEVTIAETLKSVGYATAIIGKWHLGDQPRFLPTRQGFDWFYGVPYSDDMTQRVWDKDGSKWPPLPLMENEEVIEAPCDRDGLTKRYTEKALEWITEHHDEPFFLYFPQAMPGSTKTPFASPEFKGKSANGPWGDSVEELDWSIGRLLDHLEELEIDDRTLVIWTSDNGAPINRDERDLSRGSNQPLHGRGYTTSEGAFRVPMIAWQPGKVPANTVCTELASTIDLLPTFARIADADRPRENKLDGHDITPLLLGNPGATSPHEYFYYYDRDQLQAIRRGRWKLFLPIESATHPHYPRKGKREPLLFDVVSDIGCDTNVASQHPQLVAELMTHAIEVRNELGDKGIKGTGQRGPGFLGDKVKPVALLAKPTKAIEVIESTRGGRHWVDQKTAPPKTPSQSLKSFEIEPGYELSLFAAEPLVMDPVAMAFDQRGRMFVAEYGDYPIGPTEGEKPLSRIVMLEDTDADNLADRRVVFADGLDFAHSLMPYRDGFLVGAKTKLLWLRDTDGDDVADQSEVMFDGFTPAHPQMQIGMPRWGIDNWIYLNYGPGEVASKTDAERRKLPRKDFRFNPKTLEFESDSGLGQYGNTIDRWGNRFYCTNRNPIITTLLPPNQLAKNPYHVVTKPAYDVAPSGGQSKVFPRIQMKSNYLSHAGTHTAACGTTAYIGGAGSAELNRSVFVCEPIGHLVTRSVVKPDGVKLVANRARPNADFLASTDTWFRPSSLASGPDGALYLADMYRLWVEHPKFLPAEIAAKLDWRAGEDRGRIYRITPKGHKPDEPLPQTDDVASLTSLLNHDNGWRRFLAQRLIVENNRRDMVASLRQLLKGTASPTTKLHSAWTLDGLEALTAQDVERLLQDDQPELRAAGLQLARRWVDDDWFQTHAQRLVRDPNQQVRFRLALTLADANGPGATRLLGDLAISDGDDRDFVDGLLTSTKQRSAAILERIAHTASFIHADNPNRIALVEALATVVGARGDVDELKTAARLLSQQDAGDWFAAAITTGLANGMPRYKGSLGRLTLSRLSSAPPESLQDFSEVLDSILDAQLAIAADTNGNTVSRAAAVKLLAHLPIERTANVLGSLISTQNPVEIQLAAMDALSRSTPQRSAQIVIDQWSELGPAVRAPAMAMLLRRSDSIKALLEAMGKGEIQRSALSIDQRVRLLKHSDSEIRAHANRLFGGAVSSDRQAVARRYQKALQIDGSAHRGQEVFKRVCSSCHRLGDIGYEAGPDLSDVRNRSRAALLFDILDPNAKVEPRFSAYSVLTLDGEVFHGLIVSETDDSVVVKMAQGKTRTIGRSEIQTIRLSDASMMPEGVEKDINVGQMADLLQYLSPSR